MIETPLPFQLSITGLPVLLIGDGDAANAKKKLLLERSAVITQITTIPSDKYLLDLSATQVNPETRFSLVILATDGPFAETMYRWAKLERLLINYVDNPSQSDGYIPSIVSRGPIQIGIGSGGLSPVLTRILRTKIETTLPQNLEKLVHVAVRWQKKVRDTLKSIRQRRLFWEDTFETIFNQRKNLEDEIEFDTWFLNNLSRASHGKRAMFVYLVGAGPGDPSLLTIKALQAIQKADVILYDKLVSPEILSLARRDAVLEDVGKRRGSCPVPQDEICARLVELGKQGQVICRLKGGDPYLFGRGGEEAIALADSGIEPIVIPGVTSASAIAAATGIPLTHREIARSVRFITGHLALQKYIDDWPSLIAEDETAVIYMGFSHIKDISRSFLKAGSDAATPVAVVQNGTLPDQKVVITTLEKVLTEDIFLDLKDGPILLIIGKVVTLRKSIKNDTTLYKTNTENVLNVIEPSKLIHEEYLKEAAPEEERTIPL